MRISLRNHRGGSILAAIVAQFLTAVDSGRGRRYTAGTWAEDRATRGRDLSADPGAKTGAGGTMPPLGIPGLASMR